MSRTLSLLIYLVILSKEFGGLGDTPNEQNTAIRTANGIAERGAVSCSPLIGDVGWDGLRIWVYLSGIRRRTIGVRVGWKRLETRGETEERWMVFGFAG